MCISTSLEAEGLLNAKDKVRRSARWLAVAASLMVAVSLGWWMWPEPVSYPQLTLPTIYSSGSWSVA